MTGRSCHIESMAATWLARRDGDHWTPADQRAFQAWLEEDVAHRVAYLRLDSVWKEAARLKVLDVGVAPGEVPPRGAWASSPFFDQRQRDDAGGIALGAAGCVRQSGHKHRRRRWLATGVAATLVAVVVLAGAYFWYAGSMVHHGQWQTAIGRRQVVHLADGSTVTLAGDSRIRTAMDRNQRNINLMRGEAFFTVAKDHARPFIVHAGNYQVIAVGTRFDVRRAGDDMRVVVTRGVVRLQSDNASSQPATDLPAGSVALVDGHTITVRSVSSSRMSAYLSWRKGLVVFDGTPLAKAVAEFNRYNQHQIVIGDPSLGSLRVGGHFRLDNSDAFVRLVQQMFPIRVQHRHGRIVLLRRVDKTATR